jgi:hypothetical protein
MTEPDIVRVIDDLRHCDGRHRNIGVYTFDNAIEAIQQLRKERDEARREVCDLVNMDWIGRVDKGVKETAIERGWDCYKERDENA